MSEEAKKTAPSTGVHFTQTAEFKEALAASVKEALASLVPAAAAASESTNAMSIMSELALRIAQLSDQGMPEERKRIDPAELERRERAREAMGRRIMACRERGYKPQWRATNKSVLNETMINPYYRGKDGTMIPVTFGWDGEPNDCMYPLCEDAVEIFKLFKESRGNYIGAPKQVTKAWATASGVIINSAGPVSAGQIEVPHFAENVNGARFSEGLDLKLPNDPNAREVNILGTLAKPAVQNAINEGRA